MITFFSKIRKAKLRTTPTRQAALSARMEKAITVHLADGIKTFRNDIETPEMTAAWAKGDYSGVMHRIPWHKLPDHLQPVFDDLERTAGESAKMEMVSLPSGVRNEFRMDLKNPAIKRFVRDAGNRLAGDVEKDGRKAVSQQLTNWFNHATTPRQFKEALRSSRIGLINSDKMSHVETVNNYFKGLIKGGMEPGRAEKLADDYADRLLEYRLRMIARTETANAMAVGRRAVWSEAINQGLVEEEMIQRMWVHVDGCKCEVCQDLDEISHDEPVGFNEPFVDGEGNEYNDYPAHPNCGCYTTTEVSFLRAKGD